MNSRVMEAGRTPEQWVQELARRGVNVSERTLRARARQIGACRTLGKAMILLPEHIDQIFEEPLCRSQSTSETESSGFEGDLLMVRSTSEKALERLMRISRKPQQNTSRAKPGSVVFLDQTPRNRKTN